MKQSQHQINSKATSERNSKVAITQEIQSNCSDKVTESSHQKTDSDELNRANIVSQQQKHITVEIVEQNKCL